MSDFYRTNGGQQFIQVAERFLRRNSRDTKLKLEVKTFAVGQNFEQRYEPVNAWLATLNGTIEDVEVRQHHVGLEVTAKVRY